MKKSNLTYSVIILTPMFLMTLVGCDFLGLGPKKEVKKAAPKAQAPVAPAAVVTTTEAAVKPLASNELARVGDWTLTVDEFNERLKLLKQGLPDFNENDSQSKQMVLDELIRQQLLVKDAEGSDIANQKDIKDAVEDFRKTLLVQELANRLTKDVVATEEDAQKYYAENKDLFVEPIKWKVREIVAADEAAAKNILVQVLQGADFAETAKTQSKGKSASSGGDIKEFTKAPFAAMQSAIANLEVGGVSAVFKGTDGYYIVKVDAKSGGTAKPFAEVKTELISGLTLRKQQQAVLDHLNALAEKNKIEINKELLGVADTGKK